MVKPSDFMGPRQRKEAEGAHTANEEWFLQLRSMFTAVAVRSDCCFAQWTLVRSPATKYYFSIGRSRVELGLFDAFQHWPECLCCSTCSRARQSCGLVVCITRRVETSNVDFDTQPSFHQNTRTFCLTQWFHMLNRRLSWSYLSNGLIRNDTVQYASIFKETPSFFAHVVITLQPLTIQFPLSFHPIAQ